MNVITLRCSADDLIAEHMSTCVLPHPARNLESSDKKRFENVLADISYKTWHFGLHERKGLMLMQLMTTVPDAETGKLIENNSRLIGLCPGMNSAFLVDLAFELVREFELHEAAESFRYQSVRSYFPHAADGRPLDTVLPMRTRVDS